MVTPHGLLSCGTAFVEPDLATRHEPGLRQNNRAEVSHRPVWRRGRKVQRFGSPGSAQRLHSVHVAVCDTHNVRRHPVSRRTLRALLVEAMPHWHAATAAA